MSWIGTPSLQSQTNTTFIAKKIITDLELSDPKQTTPLLESQTCFHFSSVSNDTRTWWFAARNNLSHMVGVNVVRNLNKSARKLKPPSGCLLQAIEKLVNDV